MRKLYIIEIKNSFGERRVVSYRAKSKDAAVSRVRMNVGEVIVSAYEAR